MNFDFIKGKVKKIDSGIIKSFEYMPADRNDLSKGFFYRYRRFSRLSLKNHDFEIIDNNTFYQSKNFNRLIGGKLRKFSIIKITVLKKILHLIKKNFLLFFDFKKNYEIGIHQIRIKCGINFVGYPVPEGWHKDGFDYVIILNIKSRNIVGGITRIKTNLNLNKCDDFSDFLQQGDYLFINDKKFNHYTDPINIKDETKPAYRDTIVITVKKLK